MRKVFKYPVPLTDAQEIALPIGAKFLDLQVQHGALMMWCEIDDTQPLVGCTLFYVGTGQPIYHNAVHYLATVQTGAFVWHLYSHKPLDGSELLDLPPR